jgi:rRNA biogenesis protein RRP5
MAKKFGRGDAKTGEGGLAVWLAYAESRFRRGDGGGARELLKRAVAALPTGPLHVEAVVKFALLEYRWSSSSSATAGSSGAGAGSQERGRTMLEGLLAQSPKRLDIWSVYLDAECGAVRRGGKEDVAFVRGIFRRCTGLRLSSKKMKFTLKKWLAFERASGDAAGVAEVQAVAKAYVDRASGGGGGEGEEEEE